MTTPTVPATAIQPRWRILRDSLLIAGRNGRKIRRDRGRIVYPLVQPVVVLLLFLAVFRTVAGMSGSASRQFLVPGIIIENITLTAPLTGTGLVQDAVSGLADRFRALPMAPGAVLFGRLAWDAVIFAFQALILIAVAALFGFRVHSGAMGVAGITAASIAFGIMLSMLCAWIALRLRDAEKAQRVLFIPMVPVAFISSAFAPVSYLPTGLRQLGQANPVTAAVDVARALASGGPLAAPLLHLAAWVIGLTTVAGVLAVRGWQRPAP
jgi:ABC-2 type transport system permease protein